MHFFLLFGIQFCCKNISQINIWIKGWVLLLNNSLSGSISDLRNCLITSLVSFVIHIFASTWARWPSRWWTHRSLSSYWTRTIHYLILLIMKFSVLSKSIGLHSSSQTCRLLRLNATNLKAWVVNPLIIIAFIMLAFTIWYHTIIGGTTFHSLCFLWHFIISCNHIQILFHPSPPLRLHLSYYNFTPHVDIILVECIELEWLWLKVTMLVVFDIGGELCFFV